MRDDTPRTNGDHDAEDGTARGAEGAVPVATPRTFTDAKAVRARLAPASAFGGEPSVRVGRAPGSTVSTQRHHLVDGVPRDVEVIAAGGDRYVLRDGGHRTPVIIGEAAGTADGSVREVIVDGFRFEIETVSDQRVSLRERATRAGSASAATGPLEVRAVIPGKVVGVSVAPGDAVVAGQQLLVVEAMKMQNELRSPRDGTISRVGVGAGVNIEVGDLLVVIS